MDPNRRALILIIPQYMPKQSGSCFKDTHKTDPNSWKLPFQNQWPLARWLAVDPPSSEMPTVVLTTSCSEAAMLMTIITTRTPKDHINIRILQNSISNNPPYIGPWNQNTHKLWHTAY